MAFFPPSSSAGILTHMRSNVLCAVCKCVRGMANEDRWGSFKEPRFTNREVSWSSNSPCSLREAELLWRLAASWLSARLARPCHMHWKFHALTPPTAVGQPVPATITLRCIVWVSKTLRQLVASIKVQKLLTVNRARANKTQDVCKYRNREIREKK